MVFRFYCPPSNDNNRDCAFHNYTSYLGMVNYPPQGILGSGEEDQVTWERHLILNRVRHLYICLFWPLLSFMFICSLIPRASPFFTTALTPFPIFATYYLLTSSKPSWFIGYHFCRPRRLACHFGCAVRS